MHKYPSKHRTANEKQFYLQLAELEQTLIDECVELQQCRSEIEASLLGRVTSANEVALFKIKTVLLVVLKTAPSQPSVCTSLHSFTRRKLMHVSSASSIQLSKQRKIVAKSGF